MVRITYSQRIALCHHRLHEALRYLKRLKAIICADRRSRCGILISIFIMAVVYQVTRNRSAFLRASQNHRRIEDSHRLHGRSGEKVIFIFSNQRSGSTFLGDFFNRNPSLFYLYEPLFPFGFYCDRSVERRMQALGNMSSCDFRQVSKAYREASQIDRVVVHDRCLKDNLCYSHKSEAITNTYASFCNKVSNGELTLKINEDATVHVDIAKSHQSSRNVGIKCRRPAPYNLTLVSGLCATSTAVVYKILRVCNLSFLEDIYDMLEKKNKEVYVIHLVRDPRAIMRSANAAEGLRETESTRVTDKLCQRMERNIKYVESRGLDPPGMTSHRHYRRIRYEDIAKDPMNAAKELYKFVGLSIPEEVTNWLKDATSDPSITINMYEEKLKSVSLSVKERKELIQKISMIKRGSQSEYGTVRDSKETMSKWRKIVPMMLVKRVQESCKFSMERLGYIPVQNEEKLRNLDIDLVKNL